MARKLSLEKFIENANAISPHYDFSLINEYKNNVTKVPVICHKKDFSGKEHGVFMISPADLLKGKGCGKCNGKGFSNDERKEFCSKLFNNKYDYSKSDFSSVKRKTIVICPEHGEFETSFDKHFNQKTGCKYCSYPVRDTNSFKKEAEKKHNGFYNYDKSNYINSHDKLTITCPIHGDFSQTPNAHLRGEGCPKCNITSILENKVENMLKSNEIYYIKNKKAKWLVTENGGQSHIDFFIPKINLAIECQGKQHFGLGGWKKTYDFSKQHDIDKWKYEQCKNHNIKMIYFANKSEIPKNYFDNIFVDEIELLKYIKYLFIK